MGEVRDGGARSGAASVALVGHCGPDSWLLKNVVSGAFPGAEIAMVDDEATARSFAECGDLLLINRVLAGDFADDSGIELIRRLMGAPGRRAAVMLVSNFAEAQAEAMALGAVAGFGKTGAGRPESARLMQDAVAGVARA